MSIPSKKKTLQFAIIGPSATHWFNPDFPLSAPRQSTLEQCFTIFSSIILQKFLDLFLQTIT